MTVAIRPARAGDLRAIVEMERATPELPHWSEAEYGRYLGGSVGAERIVLVAETYTSAAVVGFAAAALRTSESAVAELESLVVRPESRRSGIATLLCRGVVTWSRMQQVRSLGLEVRSKSTGAIALYRSLGFEVSHKRSRYYADPVDDALVMSVAFGSDATHL